MDEDQKKKLVKQFNKGQQLVNISQDNPNMTLEEVKEIYKKSSGSSSRYSRKRNYNKKRNYGRKKR